MKFKLIFGRTCTDYNTCWTDLKEVEVEVPDDVVYPNDEQGMRHMIGALMLDKNNSCGDENA